MMTHLTTSISFRTIILAIFSFSAVLGQSNSPIDKLYTESEQQELHKLSEFVLTQMLKGCEGTRQACQNSYFEQIDNDRTTASVDVRIDIQAQEKLFDALDPSIFKDIWSFVEGKKRFDKELKPVNHLTINHEGRFARLLVSCHTKQR